MSRTRTEYAPTGACTGPVPRSAQAPELEVGLSICEMAEPSPFVKGYQLSRMNASPCPETLV